MGCGYVARSFSGDAKQMSALFKGAVAHGGAAVLDIVSPCVTFNNHEGSTKSYPYAKEHEEQLHELGFVPFFEEIQVEYDPGTTKVVEMHDHSKITLKKLGHEYDPSNRTQALDLLHKANMEQLFLTGLIYLDETTLPMDKQMGIVDEPLATLPASKIVPPASVLAQVMDAHK
jgi:2-oxoglutarate ferredoxin oxidoreductase subunit beta